MKMMLRNVLIMSIRQGVWNGCRYELPYLSIPSLLAFHCNPLENSYQRMKVVCICFWGHLMQTWLWHPEALLSIKISSCHYKNSYYKEKTGLVARFMFRRGAGYQAGPCHNNDQYIIWLGERQLAFPRHQGWGLLKLHPLIFCGNKWYFAISIWQSSSQLSSLILVEQVCDITQVAGLLIILKK